MDFTEQLAEHKDKQDTENSDGVSLLNDLETKDQLEEQKRQNGKFQSAFDGSDLNSTGASLNDYDYENEFNEGNSFKPDEEGGIALSNKNIKEGTQEIAGFDAVTGTRFKNQYSDNEGYIQEGLLELQDSNVNTKTGAPPEDMLPLTKIAKGVDGTYDDFVKAAKGPWSEEQLVIAWDAKEQGNRVLKDIETLGARRLKDDPEDKTPPKPYRSQGLEENVDETELMSNAVWLDSGRKVLAAFNPKGAELMTDEEVHKNSLYLMSQFNWNIPGTMALANAIEESNDPELAKSFLFLMDQNEITNVSGDSFRRAISAMALDPISYVTAGGSILATRLAGQSMKFGIRKALVKMLATTAVDSIVGGAIGATDETKTQDIEIAAKEREKHDAGKIAKTAAVSAAATAVIGTSIGAAADPFLRKFGTKTVMEAADNIFSPRSSMGMGKQKGIIELGGEKTFTPSTIEFRSKLIEELDKGIKGSTISTKKLKNKLNLWINEGKIQQQEVDWSGLNLLEKDNISISEIREIVGANRPVPTLQPVAKPVYGNMTLSADTTGYRERIITINKAGRYAGPHWGESVPEGEANVGHLRSADSKSGGKRGTMLLEAQSDIRKIPRHETEAMTGMAKSVKEPIEEKALNLVEKAMVKTKDEFNEFVFSVQQKYKLNPQDKNYVFRLMEAADEADKSKLDKLLQNEMRAGGELEKAAARFELGNTSPEYRAVFTPFRDRKSSNDLMFRSAVMDAMNDGSEFLSWPKTPKQVSIIEGWGGSDLSSDFMKQMKGATDVYTKDFPKIAKAHGFKVEEYVPDEFTNKTRMQKLSGEAADNEFSVWLSDHNYSWDISNNSIIDIGGKEVISFPDEAGFNSFIQEVTRMIKEVPFENNKFYRIVFDDVAKTKWKEDGAAMYSFGAPAAVGAGASLKNQDRDNKGRFK